MAFVSWAEEKAALEEVLSQFRSGAPFVGEYDIGGRRMKYRSPQEMRDHYDWVCEKLAKQTAPRRSFGSYRGFS